MKALRQQVGYVMQEPVLFNTTIKENILYGDMNASDEQILKVAEMANALSFIESNVEDLDKDQRLAQNRKDLVAEFNTKVIKENHGMIDLESLSDTETSLLLQVLLKADQVALDKINS